MKKGDLLFLIIVLIGLFIFLLVRFGNFSAEARNVEVKVDGTTKLKVPLKQSTSRIYSVVSSEGSLSFIIDKERVYVLESTCKDKLCIKEGAISRVGESVICLPNRITISIVGEKNEVDSTTY
ncbi:MAG: NusG domain II-containing protein [Fervidobacterium sp.]